MVAVAVLHGVEGGIGAVLAARGDHADLLGEVDETFQDQGFGDSAAKAGGKVAGLAQHRLALAVVAEPRGLQHRGQTDPPRLRLEQRIEVFDRHQGAVGDAGAIEEGLLQRRGPG